MAAVTTTMENMIDPEVMADMISARLDKAIKVAPFASIDDTLAGQPGDTITIPCWKYIGDAEDVAEGGEIPTAKLESQSSQAKIKKAGKGVNITDEAILSGYGNPEDEAARQLVKSIASKIDNDCMDALQTATKKKTNAGVICYDGVVGAEDLFEEEDYSDKVIFVHPKQITQLRMDNDFKDRDRYPLGDGVIMTGVIGKISGCQVVPSKKVPLKKGKFICPIVKITTANEETEVETPALTIMKKRDVTVETGRDMDHKYSKINADEHYVVALTNDSKVVLAEFDEKPSASTTEPSGTQESNG